jgi:hypothetical protein
VQRIIYEAEGEEKGSRQIDMNLKETRRVAEDIYEAEGDEKGSRGIDMMQKERRRVAEG